MGKQVLVLATQIFHATPSSSRLIPAGDPSHVALVVAPHRQMGDELGDAWGEQLHYVLSQSFNDFSLLMTCRKPSQNRLNLTLGQELAQGFNA